MKKNKCSKYQRLRFKRHFGEKKASQYLTSQQVHLYQHCLGICQPDTVKAFNHSVEYYDGLCKHCQEPQGVKLISVNRQVCLSCKKAQCLVCQSEVDPDPEFGCFHFSPDTGHLLGFIPEYCPLYSIGCFPGYSAINSYKNKKDCKLCSVIKGDYPEYEFFCDKESDIRVMQDGSKCEKIEIDRYTCNLCGSKFDFVCEFDLHMRSHTKFGKNIALIGLKSPQILDKWVNERVTEDKFLILENELFKVTGISAVLVIFRTRRLKRCLPNSNVENFDAIASVLLSEGTDINIELNDVLFDKNIIELSQVICIRSHFVTDTSTRWIPFDSDDYKRKSFEELLRWEDQPLFTGCGVGPDSTWYKRNTSLLTSRCSLQLPSDRYQGLPETPLSNFETDVCQFLWRRVKNSDLCCCKSKFYCSSSPNINKCEVDCCGKCKEEHFANASAGFDYSVTDKSSSDSAVYYGLV